MMLSYPIWTSARHICHVCHKNSHTQVANLSPMVRRRASDLHCPPLPRCSLWLWGKSSSSRLAFFWLCMPRNKKIQVFRGGPVSREDVTTAVTHCHTWVCRP